jgi:hypothetical protein
MVLNISCSPALRINAAVIGPFYYDPAAAIQTMMNIHTAGGIMDVGGMPVGAQSNGIAIGPYDFV